MNRKTIEFNEAIELFINTTLPSIKAENEVPNINFIFDNTSLNLIEWVYIHPFELKGSWTPNIEENHLELLKKENNMDEETPTIVIKDGYMFFMHLVRITNEYIRLCSEYKISAHPRSIFMKISRRIFLRMGIEDFENVEQFLQKQYDFLLSREFEEYKYNEKISDYKDYEIYVEARINHTWDETNRNLTFTAHDKNGNVHDLSRVDYEIRTENNEKVCYIYAVQNVAMHRRIKKFERSLYSLNKGIENPNVHPTQLYTILLFIEQLKKKNVTKIKVPTIQVLNYRYHELLSESEKERFSLKWHKEVLETYNEWSDYRKAEYAFERKFYEHVVDNMDYISYLKTEKLFSLIDRATLHVEGMSSINDLDTAPSDLIYVLKSK